MQRPRSVIVGTLHLSLSGIGLAWRGHGPDIRSYSVEPMSSERSDIETLRPVAVGFVVDLVAELIQVDRDIFSGVTSFGENFFETASHAADAAEQFQDLMGRHSRRS